MSGQGSVLTPSQAAAMLQAVGIELTTELQALPEPALGWHPAPGEWCVKEALGHMIEAERRGFAGRVGVLIEGEDTDLQTWDQEAVARERRDCERELSVLLAEFGELREASIILVGRLHDLQLGRGGHHPEVGYLRVRDVLHEWIHHDRNHFRQILANVQGYVWPHMANAQRFSEIEG
jgi:hypothetical protein